MDTGALIRDLADLLAQPAGFQVKVVEPMPLLPAERIPLETVFRNLIGNAIKHHHDAAAGFVEVAAKDCGAYYEFTVTDNGPGIDPAYHQRIFELFQTLKPRDTVEGSGNGLAIVKRLVESRGGTVTVDSAAGAGARFRFTWPKLAAP